LTAKLPVVHLYHTTTRLDPKDATRTLPVSAPGWFVRTEFIIDG